MRLPITALLSCALVSTALADSKQPAPKPQSATAAKQPAAYSGLGAESVSAADIAKFAAPPLDPKNSRRIQTMLDVRGAGGGAMTKTGTRMFFNWRVTGTTQVWRQDGPMKLPSQLTGGEDNTSIAGLAPDDSYLVVSRDIGGQENPGLYLLDPNGGPLKLSFAYGVHVFQKGEGVDHAMANADKAMYAAKKGAKAP